MPLIILSQKAMYQLYFGSIFVFPLRFSCIILIYSLNLQEKIGMFDSFFNNIYLSLWSGEKKVGSKKQVLLSKSCETYGDAVYDLRWTLKYIHKNGQTSHSVTVSERAGKWNLKKTIRRVEKHVLPKEIEALIQKHKQTE